MSVALGGGQPFQHQHTRTFTPPGAVGSVGERFAAAIGGQSPLPGELHEPCRRGHHRHAASQRQRAFPRPQSRHRLMQRHQTRRTRRIHRHRRPLQPQHIRHPTRHHTRRRPDHPVPLDPGIVAAVPTAPRTNPVGLIDDADEDSGISAAQRSRIDAGVFERFPRGSQHQALLGVHRHRFPRADPEEPGIELARVLDEPTLPGIGLACHSGFGVVEGFHIPTSVGRESRHPVTAVENQTPQLLRGGHSAGESASDTHDRHRLRHRYRRRRCCYRASFCHI